MTPKTKTPAKEKKRRGRAGQAERDKPIGRMVTLNLSDLIPNGSNRKVHEDSDLRALAQSIATVGLLCPLIVRAHPEQKDKYGIIAGERRYRAMRLNKSNSAPCILLESGDEDQGHRAEVIRVVENHQRRNLDPLEEAAAVRGLLDMGLEPEAVARSLGRSRAWVARRASLSDLSEEWLGVVKDREFMISSWPPSHLEVISRFPVEVQNRILEQHRQFWRYQLPTLRDLAAITSGELQLLSAAPWPMEDATLCPKAGACSLCLKRSSRQPDLFTEELLEAQNDENGKGGSKRAEPGDRCLDRECWARKSQLFVHRKAEALKVDHPDLILLNREEASYSPPPSSDSPDAPPPIKDPVYDSWDVAPCKKSDKNAVPALVVQGPGLGQVKWVCHVSNRRKIEEERKGQSGGEGSPAGHGGPKTAQERREPYDKRRRQIVIDSVKMKLAALAEAETLATLEGIEGAEALTSRGFLMKTLAFLRAALSESGWRNDNRKSGMTLPDDALWEAINGIKNGDLSSKEMKEWVQETCWTLLRYSLQQLSIRLCVRSGEKDNATHYAEAARLCALLKFDLANLRAQAAEAVPYAKGWKVQVEDEWVQKIETWEERKENVHKLLLQVSPPTKQPKAKRARGRKPVKPARRRGRHTARVAARS